MPPNNLPPSRETVSTRARLASEHITMVPQYIPHGNGESRSRPHQAVEKGSRQIGNMKTRLATALAQSKWRRRRVVDRWAIQNTPMTKKLMVRARKWLAIDRRASLLPSGLSKGGGFRSRTIRVSTIANT